MALAGLISAVFGVLLEPIERDLGWSRAEISTGPLVISIMGAFLATPAGYLIDRWGSRITGTIAVLSTFIGIFGMSQIGDQLWHWWAAWAFMGISGSFVSTVWMMPISTLFNKGRGMAIAVTISGASVTAAIAPLVTEYFVQAYDWRIAFKAIAIIWCGITLPLVIAFVPGSRRMGHSGKEQSTQDNTDSAEPGGFTPREGYRSPSFYLIFLASLVSGLAALALLLNLVPILIFTGIPRTDAVWIAGILGLASFAGRLFAGWLMDKFDIRKLAILGGLFSAVLPISLLIAPGIVWAALAAMIFHGLTGGLRMSAVVYLTSTYLGSRSFGLLYGTITITTAVASGLGPLLANYAYDLTLSYWPTIWAAIAGFLLSSMLFAGLGKPPDFSHSAADQRADP